MSDAIQNRNTAKAPYADHEILLTPGQLGKRWNMAIKTLANMRSARSGIPFVKLGERGSVRKSSSHGVGPTGYGRKVGRTQAEQERRSAPGSPNPRPTDRTRQDDAEGGHSDEHLNRGSVGEIDGGEGGEKQQRPGQVGRQQCAEGKPAQRFVIHLRARTLLPP